MVSSLCPTTSPLAGRAAPTPAQQHQPRDINACCECVAVLLFGDTVHVLSRVWCSPAPIVPLSTTTAVTPAPCAHHNAIGAAETKQPFLPCCCSGSFFHRHDAPREDAGAPGPAQARGKRKAAEWHCPSWQGSPRTDGESHREVNHACISVQSGEVEELPELG